MKTSHRLGLLVAIGVGVVAAPVCGARLARIGQSTPDNVVQAIAPKPVDVKTETPNDFVAVLVAEHMANLSFRAEGRVTRVNAKVGASVRAGDELVTLDQRELEHALAMARASLRMTHADAMIASADLHAAKGRAVRRASTVDIDGRQLSVVSSEEIAQARADALRSNARVASAAAHAAEGAANVQRMRLAVEESTLRAPFDGEISSVFVGPGTTIKPSETVVRLIGGSGLRVRFAVPEAAASLLSRRRARVEVGDRVFEATIDQVAPEVDAASRMFLVEGRVVLGTLADARALAGRQGRAKLLPD